MAYTAGKKAQRFVETFQVLEGLPHDVLIGKDLMASAHMMMLNPDFAHPPEHPGLCLMELSPKDKGMPSALLEFGGMGTNTHMYRFKSESHRFPEAKSCRAAGCLRSEAQSAGGCCAKIEEEASFWASLVKDIKAKSSNLGTYYMSIILLACFEYENAQSICHIHKTSYITLPH